MDILMLTTWQRRRLKRQLRSVTTLGSTAGPRPCWKSVGLCHRRLPTRSGGNPGDSGTRGGRTGSSSGCPTPGSRSGCDPPVPLVGLAPDFDRWAHNYRHAARLCDAVLTDPPGVVALAAAGFDRGRPAFPDNRSLYAGRDVGVLALDDLDPTFRRERLAWIGRATRLGRFGGVVVRRPGDVAEDRRWLARAKVVVVPPAAFPDNRSL
jgi:hypothetical protein